MGVKKKKIKFRLASIVKSVRLLLAKYCNTGFKASVNHFLMGSVNKNAYSTKSQ